MNSLPLAHQSQAFINYLETWLTEMPIMPLEQAVHDPRRTAIISVDVIHGFCYEGPLSSPRVAGIVAPIVRLFEQAWGYGVRNIILTQDTHEPEAVGSSWEKQS